MGAPGAVWLALVTVSVAVQQAVTGSARHAAEVGGDGIASNVETLSPDIVIQCQRGSIGAVAASCDIDRPQ